ncbi:threonine synthase [Chitinispirillales bacterium ANBcel5]|uniref:threonine synthase n=1 Tax=Cellulosispirillum alkaliphilum TaxID=3039283 RepID=UPI002A574D75|nr:threonine synthase [Chitinispirillales bacterium ANBcel5]
MNYVSTRNNHPAVQSSQAINLGMVPSGGLFVPETIPQLSINDCIGKSYTATAEQVLAPLLDDFSSKEIKDCVALAYDNSFDVPDVINLSKVSPDSWVLELWHGPTAAFKDVALQIMPHFMRYSKQKNSERRHTLIMVATSGDTGKAALEGFKDCEGISIVVFFPHGGVSEVQKLQMLTTSGNNTSVIAVEGNFDDCQSSVKELFSDKQLREKAQRKGVAFSSANSINWGRLCPQIVYYVKAYASLVEKGEVAVGESIDFCIPTGNFGNILAGYYAQKMGLPIRKLICASNKNNVLTDFFKTGHYDRNRQFHRTMSPSMDILISSNLERFLFEMTGHNADKVLKWYNQLQDRGEFKVDEETFETMRAVIEASWVDEPAVLETIGEVYKQSGYVLDTHTAVAFAASRKVKKDAVPVIIASTASPFKFSGDVLQGLNKGEAAEDEFESVRKLHELSKMNIHRAVDGLKEKRINHGLVISKGEMGKVVEKIVSEIV